MAAQDSDAVSVDVPHEYTERVAGEYPDARIDDPCVSLHKGGNREGADKLHFLTVGYDALGQPDAVRCFTKADRVAFLPASPEHPCSYKLYGSQCIAGNWLRQELGMGEQPQRGRYPLERDEDVWMVDFSQAPLEVFG